ncbi:MAG: hypothetical protein KH231_06095 [Dialister sp.]|uniref:hypothetical protein n=1 Tax=Dialister sp. TaxID=1955814 RepID=UPI001DE4824B|nr:hypothetical protein [Dialister sp.]MBS6715028.1 hypothetical protein [Dialister sp.]
MKAIYNEDDVRYSKDHILEFLEDLETGNQRIGVAIAELEKKFKENYDYTVNIEKVIYKYLVAVNSFAHGYAEYLKKGDETTGTDKQGTNQQNSD